jgi:hypothetical protein
MFIRKIAFNQINFKLFYRKAAEGINNLYQLLERNEPNSHFIFYDYSKVFARVVGIFCHVNKCTSSE